MMDPLRILLVPGGGGSGPAHWDRRWEADDRRVERIIQEDWTGGTAAQWISTLDRHIQASDAPVILVAHSLGNIVVARWAQRHSGPVRAALMVAPTDVEDAGWVPPGSLYSRFAPIPLAKIRFPTVVVASSNDPYLSLERAREFASAWGSRLELAGPLGHIGEDSNLGIWPEGRLLLDGLIGRHA